MANIFISHSSKDNAITGAVYKWLADEGYGPVFVDFSKDDGLIGGKEWWEQLSENLKRTKVLVALVSENWLQSDPCKEELAIARHEGKPLIVLRLHNCEMKGYLQQLHYIDFNGSNPESWYRLTQALREAGADHAVFKPYPDRPPFPGLSSFDIKDAALYFGREAEISEIIARLNKNRKNKKRLFVLAGPSGSGKSSLLKAGILSRLSRDIANWMPFIPVRSVNGFEEGIIKTFERTFSEWYKAPIPLNEIRKSLELCAADPQQGLELFRRVCPEKDAVPLICIDQGEELFSSELPDAIMIQEKLAALFAEESPVMGFITIRSDILGMLQQHRLLGPLMMDDIYSLLPMPKERYALLINGPINEYARHVLPGAAVDPLLRDTLIETAAGADALPLVAFTLGKLWEEYGLKERRLQLAHLDLLGGVQGAITSTAEKITSCVIDITTLKKAFVPCLAGVTENGDIVRRTANQESLPPDALAIIDQFVQERLLVRSLGSNGQVQLEIAHEVLLRQWPRLAEWIAQDFESLRVMEALNRAATAWEHTSKSADLLIHKGEELDKAAPIIHTELFYRRFLPNDRSRISTYIQACLNLEKENKKQFFSLSILISEAMLQQSYRSLERKDYITGAALLATALHANPFIAYAEDVRKICDRQDIESSRSLAWQARSRLNSIFDKILFRFVNRCTVASKTSSRLIFHPHKSVLTLISGDITDIDFANGLHASKKLDQVETVLDYYPEQDLVLAMDQWACFLIRKENLLIAHAITIQESKEKVYWTQGRILLDGTMAVVISDYCCFLINFRKEAVSCFLYDHNIYSIASNNEIVVLAGIKIHIMNAKTYTLERHENHQDEPLHAVAIKRDGSRVIFGGIAIDAMIMNFPGNNINPIGFDGSIVRSLSILEKDTLLVSIDANHRIKVWDIENRIHLFDLPSPAGTLHTSAASTDGNFIAISSKSEVVIWERMYHRKPEHLWHGNRVTGIAYNPKIPHQVISVSLLGDTSATIWNTSTEPAQEKDLNIRNHLRGLCVARDGTMFAVCGDMNEIHLYKSSGEFIRTFVCEGNFDNNSDIDDYKYGAVYNVSISFDSTRVAWVAPTGNVFIGDIATGSVGMISFPAPTSFIAVCFSPVKDAFVAICDRETAYWVRASKNYDVIYKGSSKISDDKPVIGRAIAFSNDGEKLAIANADSGINIISINNKYFLGRIKYDTSVSSLAFDPKGEFLLSAGGTLQKKIILWHPITGDKLMEIDLDDECQAVAIDPFSDTICVGTPKGLKLLPFNRWLLSKDTKSIKDEMESILGSKIQNIL